MLGHMESVNIKQHPKACVPHNLDNIEISRRFVTWPMVSNIDIYSMKKYLLYSTSYTGQRKEIIVTFHLLGDLYLHI